MLKLFNFNPKTLKSQFALKKSLQNIQNLHKYPPPVSR